MCDVGARSQWCDSFVRCPRCTANMAAYEIYHNPESNLHHFECRCGAVVTVSEPVPGLVQTRQDAEYRP